MHHHTSTNFVLVNSIRLYLIICIQLWRRINTLFTLTIKKVGKTLPFTVRFAFNGLGKTLKCGVIRFGKTLRFAVIRFGKTMKSVFMNFGSWCHRRRRTLFNQKKLRVSFVWHSVFFQLLQRLSMSEAMRKVPMHVDCHAVRNCLYACFPALVHASYIKLKRSSKTIDIMNLQPFDSASS